MAWSVLGVSLDGGAIEGRERRVRSVVSVVMALLLSTAAVPSPASGQLLSPGPLTEPHASLEGLRKCTSCHRLGKKGAADDRCLSCHVTVETRIRSDRGYHAGLDDQSCADCHQEHLGRDFALVRLDSATFDHGETGYRLEGAHRDARCGECHNANRVKAPDVVAWGREHGVLGSTLLGLDDSCIGCHGADDPHSRQFPARECETCHAVGAWEGAERFDHDRTDYPLTGQHRQASCDGCHPESANGGGTVVKYVGVTVGNCGSCHEDEHRGDMGGDCTSCHDPRGWSSLDRTRVASRFDHGRTDFVLSGRHAEATCDACHGRRRRNDDPVRIRVVAGTERASFPKPHAGSCADCHVDAHSGDLNERPDSSSCDSCHGEHGWTPASFGIDRHNKETDFPLTGAHVVTFCSGCHGAGTEPGEDMSLRFAVLEQACISCHEADDPHQGNFRDQGCEACHVTTSFAAATFDHVDVGGLTCKSCHEPDDPHAGQFGESGCEQCHETASFVIADFDHSRTRFLLDGRHATAPCASCHTSVANGIDSGVVHYRPLRTECSACHRSTS